MDTREGRFVEEAEAEDWMQRLEVIRRQHAHDLRRRRR